MRDKNSNLDRAWDIVKNQFENIEYISERCTKDGIPALTITSFGIKNEGDAFKVLATCPETAVSLWMAEVLKAAFNLGENPSTLIVRCEPELKKRAMVDVTESFDSMSRINYPEYLYTVRSRLAFR